MYLVENSSKSAVKVNNAVTEEYKRLRAEKPFLPYCLDMFKWKVQP